MILDEALEEGSRLGDRILVVAGLRAEHRRLQGSKISHALDSTELIDKDRMDREHLDHGQISDNYLASSSYRLRCRAIEALRCARVSGLGLLPFFLSTHSAKASSSTAWNWRPSAAAMARTSSSNSGRACEENFCNVMPS